MSLTTNYSDVMQDLSGILEDLPDAVGNSISDIHHDWDIVRADVRVTIDFKAGRSVSINGKTLKDEEKKKEFLAEILMLYDVGLDDRAGAVD